MVIVVLGIAAAIATPMIGNSDDLQVRAAAEQILSVLTYAQCQAIATQERLQVVFDAANESYEVQDANGAVVLDPAKKVPYRVNLGPGSPLRRVGIETVGFDGGNCVWFDRLGGPHSGPISENPPPLSTGRVVIGAGDKRLTITVEAVTGQVRIN